MNKPLKDLIEKTVLPLPEKLQTTVAKALADAYDLGKHEASCQPFARDTKAFGHPADDYDAAL